MAKACVPAGVEAATDSKEYQPTFTAPLMIIYNVIYRLGSIYQNFELVNDKFKELFLHEADPASAGKWETEYQKYRDEIRGLGQLMGYQFRNVFSVER